MPKKKPLKIEQHEKAVLDDFEKNEFVSIDHLEEEMQIAKQAAKNYAKRNNRINIRISTFDLTMIRKIALQEGLPYQTLLASIIHKFATGRLVDKGRDSKEAK